MHPILFHFGAMTLRSFGLMMALGFTAAWVAAIRLGRGTHRNADYIASLTVWMMLAGVLGARLAYVAEHWTSEFAERPYSILRIDQGGLMFYGGMIGAVVALFFFARIKKERFFEIADILAPVLPLGHAFGRIGCFLNGCCHGRPTHTIFGVQFPVYSPAWYVQRQNEIIPSTALQTVPVLPTQLFESAANFALFLSLFLLYRKLSPRRGLLTALYFMAYAIIRFVIEPLRDDERMRVSGFSIGQVISIAVFVAGALLAVWCLYKPAEAQSISSSKSNASPS